MRKKSTVTMPQELIDKVLECYDINNQSINRTSARTGISIVSVKKIIQGRTEFNQVTINRIKEKFMPREVFIDLDQDIFFNCHEMFA